MSLTDVIGGDTDKIAIFLTYSKSRVKHFQEARKKKKEERRKELENINTAVKVTPEQQQLRDQRNQRRKIKQELKRQATNSKNAVLTGVNMEMRRNREKKKWREDEMIKNPYRALQAVQHIQRIVKDLDKVNTDTSTLVLELASYVEDQICKIKKFCYHEYKSTPCECKTWDWLSGTRCPCCRHW
jgi:hypothetical protein